MKGPGNDAKRTKLASGFAVADYEIARVKQDKNTIADAIHRRFRERYLDGLSGPKPISNAVHGFTKMAIACLMIESLESFRNGWSDTRGKSELAFCSFFDRNDEFGQFCGQAGEFYKHVRCGILHQAETTGGWKTTQGKKAPLFDTQTRTINAEAFLTALGTVLDTLRDDLKDEEWDGVLWKNVRKKMNALCHNCAP
jgi:hypothetical protein